VAGFMVDIDKALVDPALVFKAPEEVVADNELSREQKIKILQRWEYDVRELQVAEEEGMEGPQPVTLDVVLRALRTLGAPADTERSAPTKQGGS
jgi:hypothetical protein